MTTLLEMAVYDRLPANSTYNTSTKKQKGTGEQIRGGEKVLAIVRIVANMGMFGTAPIFQSTLLIPSLFSFCISIYAIDHRTIELINRIKNRYIHIQQIAIFLFL
jgi:hypothetical protein